MSPEKEPSFWTSRLPNTSELPRPEAFPVIWLPFTPSPVPYRVVRASEFPSVAQQLELHENDFLHYIHRIRTSDGIRIALSHTYIPCKYLPAVDISALEGSLYEYLDETYHVHPQALDYSFAALLSTNRQKELLQVDSCALLKSSHRSIIETGELFEYTETYYAGNRFTYKIAPR